MWAYVFTNTSERNFSIWIDEFTEGEVIRALVPPDMGLSLIVPEDMSPAELLEALRRLVSLIEFTLRSYGARMN